VLKIDFVGAMKAVGFPTPQTAAPVNATEALEAADQLGYPVLVKPRTHVGLGLARGSTASTPEDIERAFRDRPLDAGHSSVTKLDPNLAVPMLQRPITGPDVEVVSVVGCMRHDGTAVGLDHCRKMAQWPGTLGVGVEFEPLGAQPFTEQALDAVHKVAGPGLFELEVLFDRKTGEHFAIDLNPRGYGQMTLAMARGNDLPVLWYRLMTGQPVPVRPARRVAPKRWTSGVQYWAWHGIHLVTRPRRRDRARVLAKHLATPRVGAVSDWADPLPGVLYAGLSLRYPRSLWKSFR
jgi:predicted ATP-grasp superfamily ATP-dependent carboligase